jgi:hypothetical protein
MSLPMKRPEFEKLCSGTFAILGHRFDSKEARAMLWAIGRQEGRMIYRRQIGGPARGLFQFERGGGVKGVLNFHSTRLHAIALCNARNVKPTMQAVYQALEHDDILACGFARLLLYTDPAPLPRAQLPEEQEAWNYYIANWRPGSPHRHSWGDFWKEAVEMVR